MMALNTPKLIRPGIVAFLAIEAEKRSLPINPYDAADLVMRDALDFDKPVTENPIKACMDAARTFLDRMEARNG